MISKTFQCTVKLCVCVCVNLLLSTKYSRAKLNQEVTLNCDYRLQITALSVGNKFTVCLSATETLAINLMSRLFYSGPNNENTTKLYETRISL